MDLIASTTAGQVQGMTKDGVLQFRGIPYAAPPVGERRFRPPVPTEPWTGVRDATTFGPIAPQSDGALEQMLGSGSIPSDEATCLTLNVYTPALDGSRPVMVWIHGGAFTGGSGSIPWYSGARLVEQGDVVVVTINYRLGALGFLHLEHLLGGDYAGSGNAGILDQVAALRWVRDNIASFGGDPGQVTIFGESAGGMSVGTLLAAPEAKGLFHRAIAQSGACHNALPLEAAEFVTRSMLDELGVTPADAKQLLDVPTDELLMAQAAVGVVVAGGHRLPGVETEIGMAFQPVVDGRVLDRVPLESVAGGSAAGVSVMTGTTRDEWALFHLMARAQGDLDEETLVRRCERLFAKAHGEGAGRQAVETYRAARPGASPDDLWVAIETDRIFRIPAVRLVERQSAHRPDDTYLYWFTFASTAFGGALQSCHAIEIPFAFDNLHRKGVSMFLGDIDDGARALAHRTSQAWLAFARTGDPNHGDLPDWAPYGIDRRATMELGLECRQHDDPGGPERELWNGVL